ncbi:MAG TPA: C45 family peptidase [Nitrososphaerales archaeon]|nr:C45 family peptidase [Nitrososphaerales archaeon]
MTQLLSVKPYQILEVSGGPSERGFKYGAHHAALIKRLLNSHYEFYITYFNTSRDEALGMARKYIQPTQDYSEDIAQELQGVAEGSGLKMEEVMMIAAFNEVFYPKLAKACTSFAVRNGATSDGLTYLGQNNDEGIDPWLDGDCTTLTRVVQKDAPNALIYTYAGAPAMMGINSAGVSLCLNALGFDAPKLGVPMLCVAREVLNQKDLDGAVDAIERANRAFALNFIMASPEGIANVEANPMKMETTWSDDVLYHANHYIFCPVEGFSEAKSDDYRKNSTFRCDRMRVLVEANKGRLNRTVLEGILRDHENRPDMICAHVNEKRSKSHWSRTLDGMIYIPEKREAWIAHGNPCESEFIRYGVA